MKHIVAFSGGLGSFAAAERVIERHEKNNVLLIFQDTKTEDDDLYRFVDETVKFLGVEFVRLCDGRDIWEVFTDVKFMGNNRIDPCSRVLKREIFSQWLKANFKPGEATLHYGIGWEEIHRLEALKKRYAPFDVEALMTEPPYLEKFQIIERLKSVGIEPPRLYAMGFPHNNCGGFCVKTGQAQFRMLFEKLPERYLYHERKQEELFEKIGSRRGFIRMRVDGNLRYLSLREFRAVLESEKKCQVDEFDFGGCACF